MARFRNLRFSADATLLICLLLTAAAVPASAATLHGEVVGIADGDTLTLLVDEQPRRIRLAAIDAPEAGQPWGNRARQALADKVFRRQVELEVVDTDRFGRLVGTVRLAGRDINREMVREGHAWSYRKYLQDDSLLALEAAAKSNGAGLWSLADPVAPWQWRHTSTTTGDSASEQASVKLTPPGDAAGQCRIKGNISSDGSRIYHLPGQRYYDRTKISKSRGERWFCSEAQAKQAGWRRARV